MVLSDPGAATASILSETFLVRRPASVSSAAASPVLRPLPGSLLVDPSQQVSTVDTGFPTQEVPLVPACSVRFSLFRLSFLVGGLSCRFNGEEQNLVVFSIFHDGLVDS